MYPCEIPPLRPYQLDVLDRARRRVGAGQRRGVIQGETGSGKTFVFAELCRAAEAKGSRALVLADRRRLVGQASAVLERFGVRHGVILAGKTRNTRDPVILAGRNTLDSWRKNGLSIPPFQLVVVDECHKVMGDTYQTLLGLFPDAACIGFTATPARNDGRSLGSYYQWIERIAPASQLIQEGWLLKPEVYAPPSLAAARKADKDTRGLAGDPVAHWRRHAAGLPTIAFAGTIRDSLALRDRFLGAGIPAEHIDAAADDDARAAAFRRLQDGATKVLCSVGLLIEGVDLPEVACALLWARFGSLIQYRQACGRIMRPAPGKTRAVVLDHAGAAGVHGLPGDDVEWSLDEGSTVGQRQKKALDEGRLERTVFCRGCGLAFRGERCPSCGLRLARPKAKPRDAAAAADRHEILALYGGDVAAGSPHMSRERFARGWLACLGVAVARGRTAGMAAAMFRHQFGLAPWEAEVKPLPPDRADWKRPAAEVFPDFGRRRRATA